MPETDALHLAWPWVGSRSVRDRLGRAGYPACRDHVRRLMRKMSIHAVYRTLRTTIRVLGQRLDKVNRQFVANRPNQLWVADFTYVATWAGVLFVAFVIDGFARRIIGWRVARSMHTELLLGAVEHALWARGGAKGVIHHSDRGSQYLSIRYTERMAETGVEPSVGSVGDSYGNALAETIFGLFKTEVIQHLGPWRNLDAVEYATLEWVDWINHRRVLESSGNVPPAELEMAYYRRQEGSTIPA